MKRILITGAGGSPSTNFVRSLRDAPEQFYIVGTDSDPYLLMRSEADTNYLIPKVSDPKYLQALNSIIKKEKISLIHAQNDNELASISANRDQLKAKVFLPEIEIVSICQNKFESYNKWEIANLKVPKQS
jgi:carbamoyl-phosphate synthase large subunit